MSNSDYPDYDVTTRKLLDISGWDDTEFVCHKYSLNERAIKLSRPPEGMSIGVLSGKLECVLPYYDLSYMLSKLHKVSGDVELHNFIALNPSMPTKEWMASCKNNYSKDIMKQFSEVGFGWAPETAVANLCIQMFKMGILTRDDEVRDKAKAIDYNGGNRG